MANFVEGGGAAFDYMVYGERDRGVMGYLQNLNSQVMTHLGTEARAIAENLQNSVEKMYNSESMRLARAAVRMVANAYGMNVIYPMTNIGELQHAPDVMIPLIMAQPGIRESFHKQQCEGYGDRYYDFQPGVVGEDHHDYQRVTDGIFLESEDDPEACVATSYLHLDEEDQLDHDQQDGIIYITWEQVKIAQAKGVEDPTSQFNGTLG
ncbi:hypothetical protein pEaSNUABM54_00281 [Erwinia phage pEa_SNUABM_54]|nr:hypothetical protein pEaSNUABM54_00281 [Erwinia phage pEa_SNUABM_54]